MAPDGGTSSHTPAFDRQLELLVATMRDYAIFLLDVEGRVRTWNAGAQRLKLWTADEVVGRHLACFYTEADRAAGQPGQALALARDTGRYEEEGWRLRKDGSRFWASVVLTALRDEDGALVGYGKVTRDLTARRREEQRLLQAAADLRTANADLDQFRRLVASVRDYAIFMLDPSGHIATWNAGAEQIKGYTADEAVGRHFERFYTEEDRARRHPEAVLASAARDGQYEEEGWRVRKDGSRFWASVTITAVHDDAGRLTGFAKVTRDLTARRAADEALREANEQLRRSNEELDRFAAVAAHDLVGPLGSVAGFADLLAAEPLTEEGRRHLEHLQGVAVRMRGLVLSLLEYARSGGGPHARGPVVVAGALERVRTELDAAITQSGVTLTADVPDDAVVLASAVDVDVLLRNLVGNAVKFAPPQRGRVAVSAERDGDRWTILVADNGPGVDPSERERIFAAFERGRIAAGHDGSGLGLAVCDRVARRNDGRVDVTSAPGQGAVFSVSLPAAPSTR